jgi:signal transduction histidine kinase
MSKKLLKKTTGSFLAYSIIILLVSAPLFYYVSHWLYAYETDEVLLFHKGAFEKQTQHGLKRTDIANWNKYNPEVEIVPDKGLIKDSIFGSMQFDPIANEAEPYRILEGPVTIEGQCYTYIERNNLVEMEGMVISIGIMFLLIIVILLVGINVISKRSAAQIWKPFYNTLSQIQNFEIDKNRPPRFSPTDIEEFTSLNKSIEKLIEKNTAIYKGQREFIENAAHELQTPLALFQAKIDTLLQSPSLNEEQSEVLDSLNRDVSRLNRLNKNLLLLSKIENDTYFEKQALILNNDINKHLGFFKEQAASKDIAIVTNFNEPAAILSNPILTEVLVNNLFLNAIRHNHENGQIIITTTKNTIVFSNTGNANPLNSEKLFNRFSKSNPSAQGNGLGLAIVKKITELNGWNINYRFENSLHSFTVKF